MSLSGHGPPQALLMEQLHALAARNRRLRALNDEICTLLGVADTSLATELAGLSGCSFDHFFAVLQSALDGRDRAPLSGQCRCAHVVAHACMHTWLGAQRHV